MIPMDFTTYQHPRHVSQRAKVLPERFLAHVTGILDVGDVLRYRISDDVGEPVTYCSLNMCVCIYCIYLYIYIYMRVCVCGMMFYVTLSLHTYVYILIPLCLSNPYIAIHNLLALFIFKHAVSSHGISRIFRQPHSRGNIWLWDKTLALGLNPKRMSFFYIFPQIWQ